MIAPHEASIFGFDFSDFFRAFLMFLGTYLGSKHGTTNGNGHH